MIDKETKKTILKAQRNEITEYIIYEKLSKVIKGTHNKEILKQISKDELKHYNVWKEYTEEEVKPSKFFVFFYYYIARIFGLTFGLKLMEKGEELAQINYDKLAKVIPEAKKIEADENKHEKELLDLINEEKLNYVGSIVLGLNDALVELTGALAGLTFALQNGRLVAVAGLITGIAASLSMGASEYLSTKTENTGQNPLKASIYTGIAYIIAVILLILPYLILTNHYLALLITLIVAIIIILVFTFYISVAKDLSFKHRFGEMAGISLGVALISFFIGYLVRIFLQIDI